MSAHHTGIEQGRIRFLGIQWIIENGKWTMTAYFQRMSQESATPSRPIHGAMRITDLIALFPGAESILMLYGLSCAGCIVGGQESLDDGCRAHGFDDELIAALLEDLNRLYAEGRSLRTIGNRDTASRRARAHPSGHVPARPRTRAVRRGSGAARSGRRTRHER